MMILVGQLGFAQGSTCGNPIVITSLPYSTTDNTANYGNTYSNTDVPPLTGAQYTDGTGSAYYLSDNDVVYAFTPTADGTFNFSLDLPTSDWYALWLFEGCPFTSTVAYHTATTGDARSLPEINLTGGTTYYIVISSWISASTTYTYTLQVSQLLCPAPFNLGASAITQTSAVLEWSGAEDSFDLEWGEAGFTQGTGTLETGITTNSYSLTSGLSHSTVYEFYVRQDCDDDEMSDWAGPFAFATACDIITSGFYEGFDTTDTGSSSNPTVPQCWTMIDTGGGYGYVSATTPNTAPRNFYMYNGSASDSGHYILVSPETDNLGDGTMRVKFWARTTSTVTDPAVTIDFGTLSDNTDETTFTVVQSIPITNVYTEYVVNIPATTDDYFGIRHDLVTKARYIYIDTVTYQEIPSCIEPSDLEAVNITTNSAELFWVSAGTLFDIEHGEAGFTPTGIPTHSGVTNNFILSDLNPSTNYEYYVRQDCGAGDTSYWSGPYSFYTACGIVTEPFYEGFDTTDTGTSTNPTVPQCWTMIDTDAGYGYVSATSPNTAPRNFYMYNGPASDPGHYILVSPETDNLGNGTMRVRFWARTTSTAALQTQVTFGTLSDNTDPSSFSALETFDLTTTYQEFVVIIPATTDDYFGFRHDINTRPRYIYIDTITYEPIPSCLEVTETNVAGLSFNSVDLTWTSDGTLFDIEYGVAGFTPTGTASTGYAGIAGTSVTCLVLL